MAIYTVSCTEDAYTDEYKIVYNSSPQAEVYMEVLSNSEGTPIGKFEFDHGFGQAESENWNPANSYYIDKYEFPNQKGSLPVVNVDWYEAREYCEAQFVDLNGDGVQQIDEGEKNKRLCYSGEWKETCRGRGVNGPDPKDGMWGYGSAESPEGTKDFHYAYGGNGLVDFYNQSNFDEDGNKKLRCNDDTFGVAKSGHFSECVNPSSGSTHPLQSDLDYGWTAETNDTYVYDLTGNVWEWVDFDFYGALPSAEGEQDCDANDGTNPEICQDDYIGQSQMLGGYYFEKQFANCNRSFIQPSETKDVKVGFRCCRD